MLGAQKAIEPLLKMLTGELQDNERLNQQEEEKAPVKDLILALSSIGGVRSLEIFESMARSASQSKREASTAGLAGLKSLKAAGLLTMLAGDSESRVESAALRQCGNADPELMTEAISKLATSDNQEFRHRAALIAGNIKGGRAKGILCRLHSREKKMKILKLDRAGRIGSDPVTEWPAMSSEHALFRVYIKIGLRPLIFHFDVLERYLCARFFTSAGKCFSDQCF